MLDFCKDVSSGLIQNALHKFNPMTKWFSSRGSVGGLGLGQTSLTFCQVLRPALGFDHGLRPSGSRTSGRD